MEKKLKVLFLSTGNSTRSQMAEGFLRELARNTIDAVSAGIEPGRLSSLAVEVMTEAGIDISAQKPKNVSECLKEHFTYVVTVCDLAREHAPIFPFTPNLIHWSLIDPSTISGSLEERKVIFRRLREDVRTYVESFMDDLAEQQEKAATVAAGYAAS